GAAKEGYLHIAGETVKGQEPAAFLDTIEGRVPLHRLLHVGDLAADNGVDPAPDRALPARHGRDIGLYPCVAMAFRDLRIAAREQLRRVFPCIHPKSLTAEHGQNKACQRGSDSPSAR